MKIDLQELKRLAGPGRIGEAIHVETRSLKALVDVVEKAQAYTMSKTNADCERLCAALTKKRKTQKPRITVED